MKLWFSLGLLFLLSLLSLLFLYGDTSVSCAAEEYLVGPGDTLFIAVWGQEQLSGDITIGPDGTISLPLPVGVISVSGMTLSQLQQLLVKRLSEYFKNPLVTVALRSLEGLTLHILGEVKSPSFYKVPQNTTVQEVLSRAGGATEWADLTRIRLLRKDGSGKAGKAGEVSEQIVDLTRFIKNGDLLFNPPLQSEDTVIIPRILLAEREKRSVTVLGAVNAPGVHELEEPLPLLEILALAKGATMDADLKSIFVHFPNPELHPESVNLESYLKGEDHLANPLVSPKAMVFVPRLKEDIYVNVVGEVQNPGAFLVSKRAQLLDAIAMAGGFTDNAQLDEITLFHPTPQGSGAGSGPVSVKINIEKYLKHGDVSANPSLKEGDLILVPISATTKRIPTIQSLFSPSVLIYVTGEVKNPGSLRLAQNANLFDVLTLAAGPLPDADLKRAILLREKDDKLTRIRVDLTEALQEGSFEHLPTIQHQDTLFIPKRKGKTPFWLNIIRTTADISSIVYLVYLLSVVVQR